MSYSDNELYNFVDALLVDNYREDISAAEMNDLIKKIIQSKPGLLDHSTSRKYFDGQYVIKNNNLYKCIVSSVQGAFNLTQWTLVLASSGMTSKTLVVESPGQSEFDVSDVVITNPETTILNISNWVGTYGASKDYHIDAATLYFHSYYSLNTQDDITLLFT